MPWRPPDDLETAPKTALRPFGDRGAELYSIDGNKLWGYLYVKLYDCVDQTGYLAWRRFEKHETFELLVLHGARCLRAAGFDDESEAALLAGFEVDLLEASELRNLGFDVPDLRIAWRNLGRDSAEVYERIGREALEVFEGR
jgi:hypothetical protein